MSVIVRFPNGTIKLLCKGAVSYGTGMIEGVVICCHYDSQDSVIYERMAEGVHEHNPRTVGKHLEHFAVDGLRTLCIAERELDEALYKVCWGCGLWSMWGVACGCGIECAAGGAAEMERALPRC